MYPKARRESLLIQDVAGEKLVYDGSRQRMHCLNPLAAAIWEACDGRTAVTDLAARMQQGPALEVEPDVVRLGLQRLAQAGLISGYFPPEQTRVSRRAWIRRMGVALPVIVTAVSPLPVAAASYISFGACNASTAGLCCKQVGSGGTVKIRRCQREGLSANFTCNGSGCV